MFNLKKSLCGKQSEAKTLKQLWKLGWISKEEFLRFMVIKKGISLAQAEKELAKFIATEKKKPKK